MAEPEIPEGPVHFDDQLRAQFRNYVHLATKYRVRLNLGGEVGATDRDNVQLKPAPFVLYRISWATTADTLKYVGTAMTQLASVHGRAVRVRWEDSFTQFVQPSLVNAMFGDSNGFLDIPRGVLLQGSQPIGMSLERLFWPADEEEAPPAETIWDFVLHGQHLLPAGVNEVGSAG